MGACRELLVASCLQTLGLPHQAGHRLLRPFARLAEDRRDFLWALFHNLGGSMIRGIHDFHHLVILNQASPRRHWRVLLSLEKKRYTR